MSELPYFSRGVRQPFRGEPQTDFDYYPTMAELFPHTGGGMPGIVYLLVGAEELAEYIDQKDDPDGPNSPDNVWSAVQGRRGAIRIAGQTAFLLARGTPLQTMTSGQVACPLYIDRRLEQKTGLPADPQAPAKTPAKAKEN